jgi:hypothetical protein
MENLIRIIDRYYFWLKSVFNDDDSYFGSRQLYLMSLTLLNYCFFSILLFIRFLVNQDAISENKSQFIFLTLAILSVIVKLVYSRYKGLSISDIKYSNSETLINIFIFFFPYIIIIVLFYK